MHALTSSQKASKKIIGFFCIYLDGVAQWSVPSIFLSHSRVIYETKMALQDHCE